MILTARSFFSVNFCAVLYESGSECCQNLALKEGGIKSLKRLSIVTQKTPLLFLYPLSLHTFLYTRKNPACEDNKFSGKSLKLLTELAKH